MDNIKNQQNNNLNHLNIPQNTDHQEIAKAKYFYNDFVQKMNKSDFCNTSRRYIAELAYVRKLKDFYLEHDYLNLSKEMSDRESFILDKLENEFGITYKD